MTNILKLLLEKNEEMLASVLTSYYDIKLSEDMLITGLA
jgi:hypothetical protein